MMHQGKIVLDVAEEERNQLDVSHILEIFSEVRRGELTDDSLLFG
jgi:putative tryptophan/tyrosine transport system ATP-binding protein